jgi:hypothetical protein
VLPTPEESKKLLEHREAPAALRDIEQKVMPFSTLDRGVIRLKLMNISLSHEGTYTNLRRRCSVLAEAAAELKDSVCLKQALRIILRTCNFINHGAKDPCLKGTATGFSMESLHSLGSFKLGRVSALHFLSITLSSSDDRFLESFKQELKHVHDAARVTTATLKTSIGEFNNDLTFAKRELAHLKDREIWSGHSPPRPADIVAKASSISRMTTLCEALEREKISLNEELEKSLRLSTDAQRYFCVSAKRGQAVPPEELFSVFASFLDELETAWLEIERQPAAWRKFKGEGGPTPTSRRHSLPAGESHAPFCRRPSLPSQLDLDFPRG